MTALRQRSPRVEHPAYLAYVRTLPCLICARPGSDPAHLRTGSRLYGKRDTGMGEKPDDWWVLPLCRTHHDQQHRRNELAWWAAQGVPDPFAVAKALYASRPPMPGPLPPKLASARRVKPRNPPAERAKVANGRKLESRSNWQPGRKLQSRNTLRHP